MSTKIRVFISSTMEDLGNERRAVVEQVKRLNLEPVNAEGLLPSGATSWDAISEEIQSSHLFVLLLGERYGWIPDGGYGAGLGKSVTHLEVDLARSLGLPILPFFKKLGYGAQSGTDDARRRDSFRREVGDWAEGWFRAEFEWADDLSSKVADALLDLFTKSTLKTIARERDLARKPAPSLVPASTPELPADFLAALARNSAILLAGAGVSASAGLATANVMAEVLARRLGLAATGDQILARHRFADLASLAISRIGREATLEIVGELLNTAQETPPTPAHLAAVATFKMIVTTNFDTLFEEAASRQNLRYALRTSSTDPMPTNVDLTICKIDGTISDPSTLVITEEDSARAYRQGGVWEDLAGLLQTCAVAVVGHSLRDERMRHLLSQRRRDLPGVYVSPILDPLDSILLQRFGLDLVTATADGFMASVTASLPAAKEISH